MTMISNRSGRGVVRVRLSWWNNSYKCNTIDWKECMRFYSIEITNNQENIFILHFILHYYYFNYCYCWFCAKGFAWIFTLLINSSFVGLFFLSTGNFSNVSKWSKPYIILYLFYSPVLSLMPYPKSYTQYT